MTRRDLLMLTVGLKEMLEGQWHEAEYELKIEELGDTLRWEQQERESGRQRSHKRWERLEDICFLPN
jgi:hypothetical protein